MQNNRHLKYTDIQKTHQRLVILYNWFYIFVYILRTEIQKYVLMVDGAGRIVFAMTILAFLVNIPSICKFLFLKPKPVCLIWISLIGFSFINSLIMGITTKDGYVLFIRENYFEPFVFLMVTICVLRKNRTETLFVLLSSLTIFVLVGLIFVDTTKTMSDRMLNKDLGNLLPLHAVPMFLVASILYHEKAIRMSYVLILGLALTSVMLCATRKAFVAIMIILLASILNGNKKKTFKVVVMPIMLFVVLVGLFYVVEYTMLGERLHSAFDNDKAVTLVSNPTINMMLNGFLGDRAIMYYYGVILFLQYPINGIGLCNYTTVTGERCRIHSEYVVQLCENGIIGFGLLIIFVVTVFSELYKTKERRGAHLIVISGFLAVVVLNFTTWSYCQDFAMVIYAIVMSTIYPSEERIVVSQETIKKLSALIYDEEDSDSR